jgi:hypothetical protein
MIPSWIGVVVFALGCLLYRRGMFALMGLVLGCSLFGGSAAFFLPSLGGSSIPPNLLALAFLLVRVVRQPDAIAYVRSAFRSNLLLIVFCAYGALGAFVLPRLFNGAMQVYPMRPPGAGEYLFYTEPLRPTGQNITTSVYMVTAFLTAFAAGAVARLPGAPAKAAKLFANLTFAHCALGILVVGLTAAKLTFILDLVRNANYGQLTQQAGAFVRISGFFPETSGFASFGGPLLVLMAECWIRDIDARRTGFAALLMAALLMFSTSSSAYVCLAVYGVLFALRVLLLPGTVGPRKVFAVAGVFFAAVLAALSMVAVFPDLSADFVDVVTDMTVGKAESSSGRQRAFWAQQGITAFAVSHGLGIGPGAFRSSSLFTAILGTTGVVGVASFFGYLLVVLKPLNQSTYGKLRVPNGVAADFGGACAVAAIVGLAPDMVGSPTPVPSFLFFVLAGFAISLRGADGVFRQPRAAVRPLSPPAREQSRGA